MTVVADNYAKVLLEQNISKDSVAQMEDLLNEPHVKDALSNPFIPRQSKHRVIDRLFPSEVRSFVKVLTDNGDVPLAEEMMQTYEQLAQERDGRICATLRYVTKPDDAQAEKLKQYIGKKYGRKSVELKLEQDPSLVGGFVLIVGDQVLDKSLKTAILRMQRHFAIR